MQIGRSTSRFPRAAAVPLLSFRLGGRLFALRRSGILDVLTLSGAQAPGIAQMAEAGTLAASGMPLLRLAPRLGIEAADAPERAALLIVGEGSGDAAARPRGVVLIEDWPDEVRAAIHSASEDFAFAILPAGAATVLPDVRIGIAPPAPPIVSDRPRALLVAPDSSRRDELRALLRSLGIVVSLADDARAPELAGGRFDAVLVDADAYGDAPQPAASPVIRLSARRRLQPGGATVAADDLPSLVRALVGALRRTAAGRGAGRGENAA